MGTIAQKLEYLNTTKSKLKDSINALGGEIDNDTTFREYAEELDTIYSNLPKATGEGSNISLSPTLKGKLELESLSGDTKQNTLTGKNLFPLPTLPISQDGITLSEDSNGNIVLNGTNNSGNNISIETGRNIIYEAGTYTMSIDNKIAGIGITYSDTIPSGALNVTLGSSSRSTTGTISSVTTGVFRINISNGISCNNFILNPQLEKGSSATSFEKYCGGIPSPNPRISSRYTSSNRNTRSRNSRKKFIFKYII